MTKVATKKVDLSANANVIAQWQVELEAGVYYYEHLSDAFTSGKGIAFFNVNIANYEYPFFSYVIFSSNILSEHYEQEGHLFYLKKNTNLRVYATIENSTNLQSTINIYKVDTNKLEYF